MRKELDKVTLILADTKNYGQGLHSLKQSLQQIKPARAIFFTDIDIPSAPEEIEVIKIKPIKSKEEYSRWIIKELWTYLTTEYVLISQWDAVVLNGDCWDDEFYNYDVVSAPWLYTDGRNIGNGGGSLRSTRLMTILGTDPRIEIAHPEDEVVGRLYRKFLEEKYDIKFPTDELADTFSYELRAPTGKTFMHHSFFHEPFKEVVMITRKAAMGDIVALEPLFFHFHKKGYRVVLNTLPQFFNLFIQHYFKVYHPQELDPRISVREINLDMAYEATPARLHLESYYEMAGIKDGELRNPKLTLDFNPKLPENKLFPRYVVLHLDRREQASRNIYNIDWHRVVQELNKRGYTVINIGKGERFTITGAVDMTTPTEGMLMWLLGGSDLFIGIDSGPANIAVAMGTKAIIFSGSVDLRYIYPDLSNIEWIHNHDRKVCDKAFCWHSAISVSGVECYIDKEQPPCTQFITQQVLDAINKIECK